jgi:hypothetical protein
MGDASTTGRPSAHRPARFLVPLIVVTVVVIAATGIVLGVYQTSRSPSVNYPTIPATLGSPNGSPVALDNGYLGVNVRADEALPGTTEESLNASGVHFARWPGGSLGDRYDPLYDDGQGAVYSPNGQPLAANATLAQFADWCESVACQSVITLPAEIDNASMAEVIVNYTVVTLGFHPTYWEIGNEPALWSHFGIPWTAWNTTQNVTVTPAEFAQVVRSYVPAIRAADPGAGIVGIGGIGKGNGDPAAWFDPIFQAEGPNLTAMAIHIYPTNGTQYAVGGTAGLFAALSGTTSIPSRVGVAEEAIADGCAHCHLRLLVDEFQVGTNFTVGEALSGGDLATYVATEIVQSLPLPIASLDYFDLSGETPGAWLGPNGSPPSASFALYDALGQGFGSWGAQVRVSSSTPGLWAAEGGGSPGSLPNLLLANANPSVGYRVDLSGWFSDAGTLDGWAFNGSASTPSDISIGSAGLDNWTVPPLSVALFSTSGHPLPIGNGRGGSPSSGPLAPPRGENAVARWAD